MSLFRWSVLLGVALGVSGCVTGQELQVRSTNVHWTASWFTNDGMLHSRRGTGNADIAIPVEVKCVDLGGGPLGSPPFYLAGRIERSGLFATDGRWAIAGPLAPEVLEVCLEPGDP